MAITWNDPIRTYFRQDDIDHMKPMDIDLGKYGSVKDNAAGIYQQVSSKSMPPDKPWSDEWIDNFGTWVDDGCPES
jgi:hypothetical protein